MNRNCCLFCDEIPADRLAAAANATTTMSKSATASHMDSTCHQAGPQTRNSFFNYMRHKRMHSCAKSIIAMAKEAGAEWRRMTDEEKCPFVMEAMRAPRNRRVRRMRSNNSTFAMNSTFDEKMPAVRRMRAATAASRRVRSSEGVASRSRRNAHASLGRTFNLAPNRATSLHRSRTPRRNIKKE